MQAYCMEKVHRLMVGEVVDLTKLFNQCFKVKDDGWIQRRRNISSFERVNFETKNSHQKLATEGEGRGWYHILPLQRSLWAHIPLKLCAPFPPVRQLAVFTFGHHFIQCYTLFFFLRGGGVGVSLSLWRLSPSLWIRSQGYRPPAPSLSPPPWSKSISSLGLWI